MKQDIKPNELHVRLQAGEALRIVDVRSPAEFSTGHVPGAINIPLDTIGADLPGIGKDETLVMVCQAGMRSLSACQKIAKTYPNLYNLVGGTGAWRSSGLAVETPPR